MHPLTVRFPFAVEKEYRQIDTNDSSYQRLAVKFVSPNLSETPWSFEEYHETLKIDDCKIVNIGLRQCFQFRLNSITKLKAAAHSINETQSINRRDTCRLLRTRLCDMDAEVAQQEGGKDFFIYINMDFHYDCCYCCCIESPHIFASEEAKRKVTQVGCDSLAWTRVGVTQPCKGPVFGHGRSFEKTIVDAFTVGGIILSGERRIRNRKNRPTRATEREIHPSTRDQSRIFIIETE
ncbi:hypothetical protein YC2023_013320 [Brassica napus]